MGKIYSFLFFLLACTPAMQIHQPPSFDWQGHRGCRGLMPENTIPAMLKAIDLGVTTLEMDVVISKDEKVLLSHEPWMNHEIATTPDGKPVLEAEASRYNIYNMTYEEIKAFDVGIRPHPRFSQQQKIKVHKPLLEDVIREAEAYAKKKKRPPLYYNIETKCSKKGDGIFHPLPQRFIQLMLPVLAKWGVEKRTIIQSFDVRSLQYLHAVSPGMKTALLVEDYDTASAEEKLKELGFTPSIYSPHFSLVTKELIRFCHEKGIKVIPWTVNEVSEIKRLKGMGVDGIISDYPNIFKEL